MKEQYSYYYSKLPRFQDALEVDSEKEGLTKVCITYWFHERKKERKKGRDWYEQKIPDFRFQKQI